MARPYEALTETQAAQFLENGYIVLHDAFSRELAEQWTTHAWARLGYERDDRSTWQQSRLHMPVVRRVEMKELAPQAWRAACDLLGGEERVQQPCTTGDGFILNLRDGAERPWQPPSAEAGGWHKDGDFFRHFLDSPEQGLLTLFLWSDLETQGGGTFVAPDSVPVVARLLAEHPEGLLPGEFDFRALIRPCHRFIEFTGQAGDVALLHPYILHASSQNIRRVPRFLTNPPIALQEPMNFHRADPDDYSLVERAVLRGLGVDRLDFAPTQPRERVVPERVRIQQKMLEEERARLGQAG